MPMTESKARCVPKSSSVFITLTLAVNVLLPSQHLQTQVDTLKCPGVSTYYTGVITPEPLIAVRIHKRI